MKLIELNAVTLDNVTHELIRDVHENAKQIKELRPLKSEILDGIMRGLLGVRVYNSNAIEGNTMNLRETYRILQAGTVLDVGRRRESQEVIGLGKAIQRINELGGAQMTFANESEFLAVHRVLMQDVQANIAGVYRHESVMIRGAKHQPPDESKVSDLMSELFQSLANADSVEGVLLATWTHWAIARIHPFFDGNGRIARLWQDLILLERQLTVGTIRQEERNEYYGALTDADDGEFNPLTQLISRCVLRTFQSCLSAQQQSDVVKDWATMLVGETTARLDDKRKLDYLRWVPTMEVLRDSFERCGSQITNASAGTIEVQVQQYPIIDQPTWESLRSGVGAQRTWFFRVTCRRERRVLRYYFFFGKHFWSTEDDQLPQLESAVCLLISEQSGEEAAIRLDELGNSQPTLRELLIVNGRLIRKRFDMTTQKNVYDQDIDPIEIAQQFFQEVLLNRLAS